MSAKATGYLELNITGFDQALKTAKRLMGAFIAGFSAYKLEQFFENGIKGAIDFGKEMSYAGRMMGDFDPGALLIVQKALEKAGMGAEEARGHISDFIKSGKNLSDLFLGAENYARALNNAAKDYGDQASVLSRSAEKLQAVWNTIESIGSKLKTFFLSMTEQFVKPLQVALDYINRLNLSKVGSDFGNAIASAGKTLIGLIANGDIWKIGPYLLEIGFLKAVDAFQSALEKAIAYLSGAMKEVGKSFFVQSELLPLLKDIFRGAGELLVGTIAEGLSKVFATIPGLGGAAKDMGEAATKNIRSSENHFKAAENIIEDLDVGKAAEDVAKIHAAGKSAVADWEKTMGQTKSGEKADKVWNDKIGKAIEDANKKFEELSANAGTAQKPEKTLSVFDGTGKVIADNLARIGGGGNFIQAGLSMEQRTRMESLLAQRQTNELLKTLNKTVEGNKVKAAVLAR